MIRFGTSGWRAVIGDAFTFRNVRLVVQAISNLAHQDAPPGVRELRLAVGFDTRFLSEKVAQEAAVVLAANRIEALRLARDAPTPALAHVIRSRQALGGVYVTGSHNPPEYNGLKVYTAEGAPAGDLVTRRLEQEIVRLEKSGFTPQYLPNEHYLKRVDPQAAYLKQLLASVDLERVRRAGVKLAIDPLYGTAREYLDRVLLEQGCAVEVIHNFVDPYFGGYAPGCSSEHLRELAELVVRSEADLGLATDGDGDRFGIVDAEGRFVSADEVLPLLLDFLVRDGQMEGGVARTVATTHMLDAVAESYGLSVHETPVGFKYLGEVLLEEEVGFAGEESAGLGLRSHMPEKDGMLACLLAAQMVASTGKSLAELRTELERQHGRFVQRHADLTLDTATRKAMRGLTRRAPRQLCGRDVARVSQLDGLKLVLDDGSWVLARLSGTEPLVRLYSEARSAKRADGLLKELRQLVEGTPSGAAEASRDAPRSSQKPRSQSKGE